jgi:hypothetical protein
VHGKNGRSLTGTLAMLLYLSHKPVLHTHACTFRSTRKSWELYRRFDVWLRFIQLMKYEYVKENRVVPLTAVST